MKPFRTLVTFSFIYSTYVNYAKTDFVFASVLYLSQQQKKRNIGENVAHVPQHFW